MNSDTEKDANQSLIELDKGLKSGNKGDQAECVISFADVFNKHPFPIFINSVCLKLSDCFNVSNNFVRLCIVRVLEESHKHLDKIQNVDEFIARIFQVVHSNDPVARAVTIRCLAACAPILGKRKNVHHAVLEALNSNDEVEVQASIHAVTEFSKVSQVFNRGAIQLIASKIEAAPVYMKLDLIPTLQYMDASQEMTQQARLICENLLDNYVAHDMVVTLLSTLTNLACRSLSDISEQLELLFTWLKTDCRQSVQLSALKNLKQLLKASPHHLRPAHIQMLLKYERSQEDAECRAGVLEIMKASVSSLTANCFMADGGCIFDILLSTFAFDINLQIASLSVTICCKLLLTLSADEFNKHSDDVMMAVQSLIMSAVSQLDLPSLKESLTCLKRLSNKVDTEHSLDVLLSLLKTTANDDCRLLICEALMTLQLPPNVVFHDLLNALVDCKGGNSRLVVMLCSVILHTSMSYTEIGKSTMSVLSDLLTSLDSWSVYRVARQALRFAQYPLAVTLLDKLKHQVSSEGSLYFITCLHSYAKSQVYLQQAQDGEQPDLELLTKAMISLTESIRSIETIVKGHDFTFHSTYLNLLYTELSNHRRLQSVCNMFWSCPPPAMGKLEGARTGDDLVRYGRLTEELRKCCSEAHQLYTAYTRLQESLLDADSHTNSHMRRHMERTFFVSQLLDTVLSGERQFSLPTQSSHSEDLIVESIKRTWPRSSSVSDSAEISITAEQIENLKEASCRLMLDNRLPLPRYFFQRLQTTSVTMNVTPQQKPGESVLLHVHSYLTLSVEGIINYSNCRGKRPVRKICVSLSSQTQLAAPSGTDLDKSDPHEDIDLSNTVSLSNEYFNTEFLLSFPQPGQHTVKVVCQALDANGIKWDINCSAEILVKSYKEKKHSTYMK
ncbi:integrator complex subunit 7-like [Watersipora subatra]|uniref:integrator complex subunit 7-like n=1 Tax=Watersipora subatra TaxID=2589382 RepID=UPI00355BADEC